MNLICLIMVTEGKSSRLKVQRQTALAARKSCPFIGIVGLRTARSPLIMMLVKEGSSFVGSGNSAVGEHRECQRFQVSGNAHVTPDGIK